jgi:undecaprenyl-diphosphatase
MLAELRAVDLEVYRAIASSPTATLDQVLRDLSRIADHSKLWIALAVPMVARRGASRQAAVLGIASIGVASAVVNIAGKRLFPRRRPDRSAAEVPILRRVRMPGSTSFPSGHSASAFAFASSVGARLPWTSLPLHLLAVAVAYSRVHTGVHYPTDAIIGAAMGSASAAATTYVVGKLGNAR